MHLPALVIFCALALPALGQETYTPRFHSVQKVGDRFSVAASETYTEDFSATIDGNLVAQSHREGSSEIIAEMEVRAVNAEGRPTVLKVKILNAFCFPRWELPSEGTLQLSIPTDGQPIKIRSSSLNPITPEQKQLLLQLLFLAPENAYTPAGVFAPEKPVQVHEQWPSQQPLLARLPYLHTPAPDKASIFAAGSGQLGQVVQTEQGAALRLSLRLKFAEEARQRTTEFLEEGDYPLAPEALIPLRKLTLVTTWTLNGPMNHDGEQKLGESTLVTKRVREIRQTAVR